MKLKTKSTTRTVSLPLVALCCIIASMLAACNNTGCTDNRSSIPLAGFYSSSTGAAVALDSIDVGGVNAPNDSLLMAAGESASQLYLPLRSTASSTAFFIDYRYAEFEAYGGVSDTIYFDYQSMPYFASEECGAMFRYRITSLRHTKMLIDSIAIIPADSIIDNLDTESLRIYFRTSNTSEQ